MSEREDLALTIMHHPWLRDHEGLYTGICPECPERRISGGYNSPSHADHLADAILAAGFRKPRTITTVEELDALPVGAVILDPLGEAYQRIHNGDGPALWSAGDIVSSRLIILAATVLYEGTQP